MTQPSILVVDDEAACRQFMELLLAGDRLSVRTVGDGVQALRAIEHEMPDLVFTDVQMPAMDGRELLRHIRGRWEHLPVIVISVEDQVAAVVEAMQVGASNYLVKPCSPERILDAAHKALATSAAFRGVPPAEVPEIVGQSRAMAEVRSAVVLAARSDFNVLIVGETGTGKEVVTRAIHRHSALAAGPFVAHNCAATPPDLFESHFFGFRRAAFTGADRDQIGLVEAAHGGVLFLDELEAMSPDQQAKLLRVIDDGEIRPLGATACRRVSVRYITATNVDPRQAIQSGKLRPDLYYRLRGFEIVLPTLRGRRDDIAVLAQHFLGPGVSLTPAALRAMQAYAWPGNVRELRAVVGSAHARAGRDLIDEPHLALHRQATESSGAVDGPRDGPLSLRWVEHDTIRRALAQAGGNHSRAAQVLGIDRSTLRRKLKEMRAQGSGSGA